MASPPAPPHPHVASSDASTCDVCKDAFGTTSDHPRAPLLLSCGHRFCKLCVARMAETALERDPHTTLLPCPFRCRDENVIATVSATDLTLHLAGRVDSTLMATLASSSSAPPVTQPSSPPVAAVSSPGVAARLTLTLDRLDALIHVDSDVSANAYAATVAHVGELQSSATGGRRSRRRSQSTWYDGPTLPPLSTCALLFRGTVAFLAFGLLCAVSTLGAFMAVRAPMSAKVTAETAPPACAIFPSTCAPPHVDNCSAGNATFFALARPAFIGRYDLPPPLRAATDFNGSPPTLTAFINYIDVASAIAAVSIAVSCLAACATCVPVAGTLAQRLACARFKATGGVVTGVTAGVGVAYSISAMRAFYTSRNAFCAGVCNAFDASPTLDPSYSALCVNLLTVEGDANGYGALAPPGKLSQNQFDFASLASICTLCALGHMAYAASQLRKAAAVRAAIALTSAPQPQGQQPQV